MKFNSIIKPFIIVISSLMLFACTKELPPGDYDANEIGKVKRVISGTIISKRAVNLNRKNQENTLEKNNDNFVGNTYSTTHGVEYVIRLNSGEMISVVQSEDLKLKVKQKILVIYGRNTRVVADYGDKSY